MIEMNYVATSAKYGTLLRDHSKAKEHVATLSGRVAVSNSASNVPRVDFNEISFSVQLESAFLKCQARKDRTIKLLT